jgi:hypothetical protein
MLSPSLEVTMMPGSTGMKGCMEADSSLIDLVLLISNHFSYSCKLLTTHLSLLCCVLFSPTTVIAVEAGHSALSLSFVPGCSGIVIGGTTEGNPTLLIGRGLTTMGGIE